uniref:Uncharacterized protein n=1 Tax=Sphaerodactylus townsendi TaxID=933632 RepID=A0ACB8EIV4_9SAUR
MGAPHAVAAAAALTPRECNPRSGWNPPSCQSQVGNASQSLPVPEAKLLAVTACSVTGGERSWSALACRSQDRWVGIGCPAQSTVQLVQASSVASLPCPGTLIPHMSPVRGERDCWG